MSIVAHKRIRGESKEVLLEAVEQAMQLANWKKYVKGKKVFIKTNLLLKKVVPGLCTSPWVIEGIIKVLKKNNKEIYIGDCNVATTKQVEEAAKNWGIIDLCKKYKITFINLSKQPTKRITTNGNIFKYLEVPEILTKVDSIISAPVLKTHLIPKMTCALKNQWGCIPTFRQQLHHVINDAIPEINKGLKINFAVVDATICLEGNGPVNGIPKIINSIFASNDLVAVDALAADFIGIDYKNIPYITNSEKLGIGSTKYKVTGDKITATKFLQPDIKTSPIVNIEMKLRKIPIINYLIFKTPLFKIPAFIASRYNTIYWYHTQGKSTINKVLKNKLYRKEFMPLIKNA